MPLTRAFHAHTLALLRGGFAWSASCRLSNSCVPCPHAGVATGFPIQLSIRSPSMRLASGPSNLQTAPCIRPRPRATAKLQAPETTELLADASACRVSGANPYHSHWRINCPTSIIRDVAFNFDWIVPGRLAQGSYPGDHPSVFNAWDVIVYAAEELQPTMRPPGGKAIYRFPIDDDIYRPVPMEVGRLGWQLAGRLADHARTGQRVLVTCAMGANRSGLLTGMTLMRMNGMSGSTAVDIIKRLRRSGEQEPLSNPMFAQFLRHMGPGQ